MHFILSFLQTSDGSLRKKQLPPQEIRFPPEAACFLWQAPCWHVLTFDFLPLFFCPFPQDEVPLYALLLSNRIAYRKVFPILRLLLCTHFTMQALPHAPCNFCRIVLLFPFLALSFVYYSIPLWRMCQVLLYNINSSRNLGPFR